MRIVVNEQLKDAIEWTCKYASEYKVDIDIHIDADGEISVSVCPTYRDTADTPQTEKPKIRKRIDKPFRAVWFDDDHNEIDTPQTDCYMCKWMGDRDVCGRCRNRNLFAEEIADTPQTDRIKTADYCDICNHKGCDNCTANSLDDYCVPSGYAPKDTPQTDCDKCIWNVCNYNKVDWDADTPQTELTAKCLNCHNAKACKENHWDGCIYEPQTDCLIVDARFKAHCLNCAENGSYKCTKCDGEMYYKADAAQTDCEDIYPLVIIKDRYTGVYSNGKYTAWNMYFEDIPREIDEDDVTCHNFWHSYEEVVGLGDTPNEAVEDLRQKMGRVQI